jgi:hypothetical protein
MTSRAFPEGSSRAFLRPMGKAEPRDLATLHHNPTLHLAVDVGRSGHHPAARLGSEISSRDDSPRWVELTARTDPRSAALQPSVERIQAIDLAGAKSIYEQKIAEVAAPIGYRSVFMVDIEVLIAPEARQARQQLAELDLQMPTPPSTLRYIGTPLGLAGLIADISAAKVADGATILPLVMPEVLEQFMGVTLPWLEHRGLVRSH